MGSGGGLEPIYSPCAGPKKKKRSIVVGCGHCFKHAMQLVMARTRSGLCALLLFSALTNAFVAVQPTRLGSLIVRKQAALCSPDDIGLVIEHAARGVFAGFVASQFIWATGSFLSLLLASQAPLTCDETPPRLRRRQRIAQDKAPQNTAQQRRSSSRPTRRSAHSRTR